MELTEKINAFGIFILGLVDDGDISPENAKKLLMLAKEITNAHHEDFSKLIKGLKDEV